MLQSLALAATCALSIALISAQRISTQVAFPAAVASPIDGRQMFTNYCSPCHGINGRGDGPLAASLREPPSDLTRIARDHRGRFPELGVASELEFGGGNQSSQMPVWGPIFKYLDKNNKQAVLRRIKNLTDYLASIQQH